MFPCMKSGSNAFGESLEKFLREAWKEFLKNISAVIFGPKMIFLKKIFGRMCEQFRRGIHEEILGGVSDKVFREVTEVTGLISHVIFGGIAGTYNALENEMDYILGEVLVHSLKEVPKDIIGGTLKEIH